MKKHEYNNSCFSLIKRINSSDILECLYYNYSNKRGGEYENKKTIAIINFIISNIYIL